MNNKSIRFVIESLSYGGKSSLRNGITFVIGGAKSIVFGPILTIGAIGSIALPGLSLIF